MLTPLPDPRLRGNVIKLRQVDRYLVIANAVKHSWRPEIATTPRGDELLENIA